MDSGKPSIRQIYGGAFSQTSISIAATLACCSSLPMEAVDADRSRAVGFLQATGAFVAFDRTNEMTPPPLH
jgi:hypothetical protein